MVSSVGDFLLRFRFSIFFFYEAYGIVLWELVSRKHPVKDFAFRKADFFFLLFLHKHSKQFEEYLWMSELEQAIISGKRCGDFF